MNQEQDLYTKSPEKNQLKILNSLFNLSLKAFNSNEIPISAIITKDDKIIAKSYNKTYNKKSSINHAEINCIITACKKLSTYNLSDLSIYVNVEPCMMCMGAIINSKIKNVYYILDEPKYGSIKSIINIKNYKFNHKHNIIKLDFKNN